MEGRKIFDSRGLDENSGFAVVSALFRHIWRAESGFCSKLYKHIAKANQVVFVRKIKTGMRNMVRLLRRYLKIWGWLFCETESVFCGN